EQGWHKAVAICIPHLTMVSLFVSTLMLAYLKPPFISSLALDLVPTLLYSVVSAALDPLLYSLRNKELR
ncbi:O11H7 protein, partial [Todus mexicanus]|nr:O11H7 protein [Todus mexicanus]